MPPRIETAWYRPQGVEVTVLQHGAWFSLVSWTEAPGISYENYVENDDLIFNEEEE